MKIQIGARICRDCGQPVKRLHICWQPVTKASPVAEAEVQPAYNLAIGRGNEWAPTVFGEYYITSALVYAAVKMRANNLVRPTLRVYSIGKDGEKVEVSFDHPYPTLLRKVNPFWSLDDLLRATSTYLDLWGVAYWALTKAPGQPPTEIWPMRPDNIRVVVDAKKYIKGYIYQFAGKQIPLLPEEVVRFRYFNPLDEFGGLSPIAPLRLSVDMAKDAIAYNRNLFRNGMLFGNIFIKTENIMTDDEVEDFHRRLKKRFASPENAHRPIIASPGMTPVNLGLTQKDMEYIQTLRWSLEDVSRVYEVPKILLQDLTNATYSNVDAAERMFWRNTMVPHVQFFDGALNEYLTPLFGDNLVVEADLSEIEALQENLNEVAARDRADVAAGILTVNEVRAERGLDPVQWGDAWWAPSTMMPIGDAQSIALPAPAPTSGAPASQKAFVRLGREIIRKRATSSHLEMLASAERQFLASQRRLFDEQKREVLVKLRAFPPKPPVHLKGMPIELFDFASWVKRFIKAGRPVYQHVLIVSGTGAVARYALGTPFDVAAKAVQDWLNDRVSFWANQVNEDTGKLLMAEINDGIANGESISELSQRVERVFNFNDAVRAERIARTETQAAMNKGSVEAYKQSGVVEAKEWVATLDDRTRDAHVEADGQIVPLESPFLVGGESIMQPGDGSPENSINCRCASAPVISQEKAMRNGHEPVGALGEHGHLEKHS